MYQHFSVKKAKNSYFRILNYTTMKMTPRFIFVASAIIVAAISRILPHFDNVTPVAAMALFGGAYLNDRRLAILLPLLTMLISDMFIGFHNTMIYVYVGMIATSLIGISIKNNIKVQSVLVGSIASSVIFFIISNFGVWASGGFFSGITGLTETYVLGIPFFRNSLLGDLFYSGVLFGAFELATRRIPALAKI